MELNMNTNRTKGHSLDEDDNFSNISRISFGMMNSIKSACNSDSECSGPISVRDMIQHYNSQFQKEEANQINCRKTYKINATKKYHHPSQHLLAATKSSYCGLNNYGSNMNEDHNQAANTCCKNCSACTCCQTRSRKNSTTTKMLSSTSTSFLLQQNNENNKKPSSNFSIHNNDIVDVSGGCNGCGIRSSNGNCNKKNVKDTRILAVENSTNIHNNPSKNDDTTSASTIKPAVLNDFCAELHTKSNSNGLFKNHNSQVVVENKMNRLLSTDSVEEANNICQQPPIETSYQSKTTIAKTSSGVRIIIDIYFDQEQCANATDIVGSRVETDIPQSRILTEFQQQTMSSNGCTNNTSAANISY